MTNRLGSSTSPYLLQHKDNPVDWWPWSDEAFAAARERDVPVLLSVGYAACHWCHVMAHESFEDPEVAAQLNANFVCIKVDREERPDVDAVYMEATQAMTGSGGWPMTVFTTPTGEPFFCGTYFPPRSMPATPSFSDVFQAVAEAWRDRRPDLIAHATSVVGQLADRGLPDGAEVGSTALAAALTALTQEYDEVRGGFGRAPKFPPPLAMEFLLRHAARTGDDVALSMADRTAEAMARGGMYDQLGGGFARYSVDNSWVVPHFEKMLYDNAMLLRTYTHLARQTGSELARRVALETADFLLADLRTDEGGFASALDADTDGVEGATYAWTPAELREALGDDDGPWVAQLCVVTDAGTFEGGTSTLQLPVDPDDAARWAGARERLRAVRAERPQPGRDDKVVTAWNGLAIAALAEAGVLLDRPEYVEAAVTAGDLMLDTHLVDGRLRRTSRAGVAGPSAGVLEDYGDLAEGLLALHQATADGRWLTAAAGLVDTAAAHFGDGDGGFFDTADDAETLVRRPRSLTDSPTPAGVSALAGAALSLSALTGEPAYRDLATAALERLSALIAGYPQAAGWAAAIGEAALVGPVEVAVVGDPDGRAALESVARQSTSPGAVVVAGEPDAPGVPLLAGRPLVDGKPAAYVCRGFVCAAPVTDPAALAAALATSAGG